MTYTVRIRADAAVEGIAIQVADRAAGGSVFQLAWPAPERRPVQEGHAMPGASLVLDDGLGRALLDALAEHYGNTSGGRQQRGDYEHERGRVDKLINHLMDITSGGQVR